MRHFLAMPITDLLSDRGPSDCPELPCDTFQKSYLLQLRLLVL
jgi:hypothetical protein